MSPVSSGDRWPVDHDASEALLERAAERAQQEEEAEAALQPGRFARVREWGLLTVSLLILAAFVAATLLLALFLR